MATQIKRDEHIRLADGGGAILSAVQLSNGKYETMLLLNDGSGEELVSYRSTSEEDALCFFNEIRDNYHVPDLTGKYKKLADDLKAALAYGLEHMGTDDGGTSNFDAPTLTLPDWDKKQILCFRYPRCWTGIHPNLCRRGHEPLSEKTGL